MIERPLEKLLVGQDRQTTCARRFVFLRDANRIEVPANHPCRWRRFLDLGNQRDIAVPRVLQRRNKIAPFAAFEQSVTQIAGGDESRGQLRDFAFFLFNDGV